MTGAGVQRRAAPARVSDLLHRLTAATSGQSGKDFGRVLVRELAEQVPVAHAFLAVVSSDDSWLQVMAWSRASGVRRETLEPWAGPALTEVLGDDVAANARNLRERFPDDPLFAAAGVESVFAVPVVGADGGCLGHLGVMDDAPCPPDDLVAVLGLLAARCAVEIERHRGENAWRALNDEQGALLRIATQVAETAPPAELLRSVTTEAGLLYEGDAARTLRYEDDAHARVLGCWSNDGEHDAGLRELVELASDPAPAEVRRTRAAVRVDAAPGEAGSSIAAPVVVDGRLWGAITVTRTIARPFPAQAEWRLGRLAELFALAIANLEAHEQLAASRARIVETSDRERRRLERNLHDGAQQRLVTLAITLRIAQSRLAHDPEAVTFVEGAVVELEEALAELRELARGIHPAVLSNRGLVPAVEYLVARASSPPVRLEAQVGGRMPEAVEAAAYYAVAESLTNVVKYSQATTATVRVVLEGELLLVEVEDDGAGGADAARGSGLSGLVDRVEALGGRLDVRSPPGEGTLVRATIPSRRQAV